jgi:Mg-chelatase subunit ChlD
MTFLAPFGLVGLVAVPALLLLWLLFSRFRSQRVSSLLLWLDVPAPVAATRSWRLPRPDLLLLLQLVAVGALGLALGRPALALPAGRHIALVLDASVSMQAQDVAPTRFAAARQALLDVVNAATPTDRFSVILATAQPSASLRDGGATEARVALEAARADTAAADLVTAVSLAAVAGVTEVVAATDGATVFDLPPQPAPITFRVVGDQAEQIALSDVAVRQPIDGSQQLAGFATLANYATTEHSTRIEIIADSVLVDSQEVSVAPGTRSDVTFSVPLNTRSLRVTLPDTDAVATDKRIDLAGPASFARSLLVVSDHPDAWQRAAASINWLTVRSISTDAFVPPSDGAITLFDGWLPAMLPDAERILVDPPDASGLLVRDDPGPRTELVAAQDTADPLLGGQDLSGLTFTRNGRAHMPGWASLTLGSADDFAMGKGVLDGRRTVVFAFELTASNLPQLAAFPVLLAKAIDWLTPGRGELVHAGLGPAVNITPHALAPLPPRASLAAAPTWFELWPYLAAIAVVAIVIEGLLAIRRRGLHRVAFGLSAVATLATALALFQPGVWLSDRAMTVILAIDHSASITPGAHQQLASWLAEAQRARSAVDRVGMVVFGRDSDVAQLPATGEILSAPPDPSDGGATDLGQALRTAGALARSEAGPSRVVLISDGHATTGELTSAEDAIAGTPVDVVPLDAPPPSPGVVLEALDVPQYVRAGDSFSATLTVGSTDASTVTLQALVDGSLIKNQQVALNSGHNRLGIDVSLDAPGFHRLSVTYGDTRVEGFVVVKPAERVLVVEERPGESNSVTSALRSTPGTFDVVAPGAITNLNQLEPYAAVVLSNVSATSFTLDQQRTLQSFVQDRARGLVALGGSTSFVLGDYDGSVLEQTLPVLSTVPPRRESARLALVLVIDISQSMDRTVDGVSGIEMAKQAAILSERSLRDDDQVGVLIFNHRFSWLQPIGIVSAIGRSDLEDRIAQLSASGGTEIFAALNEGATAMKKTSSDLRHIVLFTDGNSRDANYDALTADMRQQHIGLSTVGLGPEADTKLLARLAKDGQGRFYYSDPPSDQPSIAATNVTHAQLS